jgi:two-component system, NarL family, response regulator YdfI
VMHVLIASPIQAVRAGLRVMLTQQARMGWQGEAPPVSVTEAANYTELESWLDEADLLLLTADLYQPAELQRLIDRRAGRLALLLLDDNPQAVQSLAGLALRAWGILPLDCSAEELIAAVEALEQGLLVASPALGGASLPRYLALNHFTSPEEQFSEPLTQREVEVLGWLAQGLTNKQISNRLTISEHTVKFHISSIYTKLGVANRTEAARAGVQRGLITL